MAVSQKFIAATLTAVPDILQAIEKGLKSGGYVREGGAILGTDGSQKVVAWLRDSVDGQSADKMLAEGLGVITSYGSGLPLLNLSISAIGFAGVLLRLETVEQKMDALAREVKDVNWKLDSELFSEFQACLKNASIAVRAERENNRHEFAQLAISGFGRVENQYLALLNRDLETTGGRLAAIYFHILSLAMVSKARCFLELGDLKLGMDGLGENVRALESPCDKYFELVIGQKPAIFLHPDLADQISLERMSQLWRHREPALTENLVFERLRKQLWEMAGQSPKSLVSNLPRGVRDDAGEGKTSLLTGLRNQGGEVLKLAKGAAEAARTRTELLGPGEELWRGVVPRLAEAFAQMEVTYETLGRLRGFQSELEFLVAHDVSFVEWQQLTFPQSQPGSYGLILPPDSELLLEQARLPGASSRWNVELRQS